MTDLFPACLAPAPPGLFGASCRPSSPHDSCPHRLIRSQSAAAAERSATKSAKTSPRFGRLHGTSRHLNQGEGSLESSRWFVGSPLKSRGDARL